VNVLSLPFKFEFLSFQIKLHPFELKLNLLESLVRSAQLLPILGVSVIHCAFPPALVYTSQSIHTSLSDLSLRRHFNGLAIALALRLGQQWQPSSPIADKSARLPPAIMRREAAGRRDCSGGWIVDFTQSLAVINGVVAALIAVVGVLYGKQ